MPHFPVFKSDSATTKMRIVYDASAKMSPKSPSLNDCLHTGPNLMQDLTGILLKFRTHKKKSNLEAYRFCLQILPSSIWSDTLALSTERNNTISPKSKGQLGSTGPHGEHVYG